MPWHRKVPLRRYCDSVKGEWKDKEMTYKACLVPNNPTRNECAKIKNTNFDGPPLGVSCYYVKPLPPPAKPIPKGEERGNR